MAIVLGPELDVFLRGIGEDLKGRTRLDEPYVDKKIIIRAVSEQNKVILTMQERILQMQKIEEGMQRRLDSLQEKVDCFEHYTKKVDAIENVLDEKIPLLNKVNKVVQDHDSAIDSIGEDLERQTAMLSDFKTTTKSAILEANVAIEKTSLEVERMPETITISSSQVKHSADTNVDGDETLEELIGRHENESFMQEENLKRLEERVERDASIQNVKNIKIEENVTEIVDWKTEQKNVDLVTLRENQDSTQAKLVDHEKILTNKMSKRDVDAKLESQFNIIVEHLQNALSAVDNDEAEFKSVTESLSKMCESLREKKADKVELSVLRKELISTCANGSMPLGGSTVDNETIRRTLASYPSKDFVLNQMGGKLDKDKAMHHFERMNNAIAEMQELIHKVLLSKDIREPSNGENQTQPATSKYKQVGMKRGNNIDMEEPPSTIDAKSPQNSLKSKVGMKRGNNVDMQKPPSTIDVKSPKSNTIPTTTEGISNEVMKRSSLDASSDSQSLRLENNQGFEKNDVIKVTIMENSVSSKGPMHQKYAMESVENPLSTQGPIHEKLIDEEGMEIRNKLTEQNFLPTQGPIHEKLIDEEAIQISNELTERSLTSNMEIYHELDERFPSSSAMKGPLSKVPHKDMDYNSLSFSSQPGLQGKSLRPPSSNRPRSTPDRPDSKRKKRLKKMNSLPAILTSITKTMKPRSKQKAKNRIHKGSYQIIHKTVPTIDHTYLSEQEAMTSETRNETAWSQTRKEKVSQRNHDRVVIRTSIE